MHQMGGGVGNKLGGKPGNTGSVGAGICPGAGGVLPSVPFKTIRDLRNDPETTIGNLLEILFNELVGVEATFNDLRNRIQPVLGASRMGKTLEASDAKEPMPILSQHKTNALACLEKVRALKDDIQETTASVEV